MGIHHECYSNDGVTRRICSKYWDYDQAATSFRYKASDVAKEFKLSTAKLSKLVRENSAIVHGEWQCEICREHLRLYNRSSMQDWLRRPNLRPDGWTCDACKAEALRLGQESHNRSVREYLSGQMGRPWTDYSFRDKVYLTAYARQTAVEDYSRFTSFFECTITGLTPRMDYSFEVLRYLTSNRILLVDPDGDLSSFRKNENGGYTYSLESVAFILGDHSAPSAILAIIEHELREAQQLDEVSEIASEISREECLAFLEKALSDHRFELHAGEKTLQVLDTALRDYSVGQVYNFIWRATKDAAAYYQRGNVSKRRAANTVVSNIQRSWERAKANNWNVTSFSRNYELPQSQLSRVLFNVVLGTDDAGFDKKLSDLIQNSNDNHPLVQN